MSCEVKTVDSLYDFAATGYYFQLTLERRLLDTTHCHDFYEIIYVLTGSCHHIVNGSGHMMEVGDFVLLRPSDCHSFDWQSGGTNVAAISICRDELTRFRAAYGFGCDQRLDFENPTGDALFARFAQPDRTRTAALCDELFALPSGSRVPLCRVLLGEIFAQLIREQVGSAKEIPSSFAAVLTEMNRLPNAAEGVSAFLRISNFSHAQLCRLTKRYLDQTPGEYVNSIRMRYAWELVTAGEQDYEEICEVVGFSSFSHYCRLFSLTYGTTPAKARKSRYASNRTI